ncbi:regulator of telomere elongation helicase 1 homolog isoform X1 [Jatropha curcas]|uniref:regulator of telomere elongation helicase 1 homolog isoform X1 n=1 Tax=Jatropha curcas TaxID=180498 RepID=UPI0009D69ADD|nr:regulator of telomere elongation helicase 1 homolog isoform X1 [Jatropha curcas]
MPTYGIRGIDVDFPYEAYDCQLVYMEKVIQSLQSRCNALLESPTGTGKTLCLLCATLAWRKSCGPFSTGKIERNGLTAGSKSDEVPSASQGGGLPTIVYTSRTHSQLRQVIQELKRSSYRPKMVVLGSREQLCIHEEVSLLRGKAQNNACHYVCRKRENRKCTHFARVGDYVRQNPQIGDEPVDIEDLVNIGRRSGPCPYYISRELHKVVDILFAPYNYLIDRSYRRSLKIDWNNSILIFDEAHNLESLCADAASFDLSAGLLTACISEAKSCINLSVARREELNDKSRNPDNFAILKAMLLKLEKRIAEVPIESKDLGFTKPGPYIYELLADLNITHETVSKLTDLIEEAALLLEEDKQQRAKDTTCRLESIADILKIIFKEKNNAHANFYRVHVREVEANAFDALKGNASRTLSWWCFNPGIALEEFSRLGVGSIILTSGTLSPMDSFAQELKLNFPIRLENPHVISSNQIWAGVVPAGPSGRSFNSSYRNRDSIEYKQELGNAIVNFARLVPDGLLVFFPSYYLLDQCIGCWKNVSHANSTTIWERICKHKKPVVEPRQSSLFPLAIEDYMAKLKDTSTSGAVFFAVCRGKVSEGLDFADHAGRAVVIIGMPFPSRTDPKVRLKREFLDEQLQLQRNGCKLQILSGEDWYTQQTSRAVNQAVGRVIRHRDDYGAIIFCDERFANSNSQSQISLWIQPHIKCHSKFGDVVFTLSRFFRDALVRGPAKLKSIQSEDMENVKEVKTSQPVDKFYLGDFLNSSTPIDQNGASKSLSSLLEVRRGKESGQLKEVLPANRSSLTTFKENQDFNLKYSSGLLYKDKKLLVHGSKNTQHENHERMDLSDKSLPDEIPSRPKFLVPCLEKKRKAFKSENGLTGQIDNTQDYTPNTKRSHSNSPCTPSSLVTKLENPHHSDDGSKQNAEIVSVCPCDDHDIARNGDAGFLTQKNKGVQNTLAPCSDEEKRGSAFLIQVKEKLSAAEYKEFVGFMKALKSKAMKIGNVLESIVRLFSGPERNPLLKRFKDYIPTKYHSLYEHYLEANDETLFKRNMYFARSRDDEQ